MPQLCYKTGQALPQEDFFGDKPQTLAAVLPDIGNRGQAAWNAMTPEYASPDLANAEGILNGTLCKLQDNLLTHQSVVALLCRSSQSLTRAKMFRGCKGSHAKASYSSQG